MSSSGINSVDSVFPELGVPGLLEGVSEPVAALLLLVAVGLAGAADESTSIDDDGAALTSAR